ncbi:MAG: 4-hydroxy-tetrahydrodipicolinate reductase, partial [Lachnospiraceae bacterium]|nr:4-hydroxy-tetrahydrodipicolinate reductase [Lachnospiraceae bacterium]
MTKIIMHGCNGKMGKTIAGLIAADEEIEIVAGVDAFDDGKNPFPVFASIEACDVEADAVIDFSVAAAVDGLLEYCVTKQVPCV